MKTWVLNLKHRTDRYRRIVKALANEGVDYEVFHGVYWKDPEFFKTLRKHDMKIYKNWKIDSDVKWYNRGVNAGEAAVAMSTILMWEEMLKSGDDIFLCLQDDCVWKQGELKILMDLVENTDHHDADLIYLAGYHTSGYDYQFKPIDKWYEEPDYIYNAHAIVYTRYAIERMLAYPYKNHLMSLDEYLMIQCKTTQRMDVAEDIGVETPMKAIKVKHSQNIIQQINDMDEVISDIAETPELGGDKWKYTT
jgi:GR25 family glycosyltransferase involved in LPS biosynthesis